LLSFSFSRRDLPLVVDVVELAGAALAAVAGGAAAEGVTPEGVVLAVDKQVLEE